VLSRGRATTDLESPSRAKALPRLTLQYICTSSQHAERGKLNVAIDGPSARSCVPVWLHMSRFMWCIWQRRVCLDTGRPLTCMVGASIKGAVHGFATTPDRTTAALCSLCMPCDVCLSAHTATKPRSLFSTFPSCACARARARAIHMAQTSQPASPLAR
jgi:hypothetical protein